MTPQLREYLKTKGLSKTNITILEQHGFVTRDLFDLITPEDVKDMKVKPLAQEKLLLLLLGKDNQAVTEAEGTIRQLLEQIPEMPLNGTHPTHTRSSAQESTQPYKRFKWCSSTVKYHAIPKFVLVDQRHEEDDRRVWGNEEEGLFFKSSKSVKLEQVSPSQWSAAGTRIMYQLLEDGALLDRDIHDYLGYMTEESDLAATYTWKSVLLHDDAYRKKQAAEGFKWGTPMPHLDRLWLEIWGGVRFEFF